MACATALGWSSDRQPWRCTSTVSSASVILWPSSSIAFDRRAFEAWVAEKNLPGAAQRLEAELALERPYLFERGVVLAPCGLYLGVALEKRVAFQ
jgi:hypothetical protein